LRGRPAAAPDGGFTPLIAALSRLISSLFNHLWRLPAGFAPGQQTEVLTLSLLDEPGYLCGPLDPPMSAVYQRARLYFSLSLDR